MDLNPGRWKTERNGSSTEVIQGSYIAGVLRRKTGNRGSPRDVQSNSQCSELSREWSL